MERMKTYALFGIKALLSAAFLAAGGAKLYGVAMMVGTFDMIGVGQWFRYLTGVIEVGAAILLWVPGLRALAAGALVVTMIGAIIAHLAILGPSSVPAAILGALAALILYAHRQEIARPRA
ncbi:DoxX family membrane protein [Rhodobacterales bacterium LSUCC0031]|nr:DoxX family membrane protein [Rhodobacterales bacterium LSUCC0031]